METKKGKNIGAAGTMPSYDFDDFEPRCNWRREVGSDTIIVHVPEFKKEQLKVEINNLGNKKLSLSKKKEMNLTISGERPVAATKLSRFYKEIRVPKDCNINEINAKFNGGLLYIIMPKRITNGAAKEKIESSKNATNCEFKQEDWSSILKRTIRLAINVAMVVGLVAVIGGYVMHEYCRWACFGQNIVDGIGV